MGNQDATNGWHDGDTTASEDAVKIREVTPAPPRERDWEHPPTRRSLNGNTHQGDGEAARHNTRRDSYLSCFFASQFPPWFRLPTFVLTYSFFSFLTFTVPFSRTNGGGLTASQDARVTLRDIYGSPGLDSSFLGHSDVLGAHKQHIRSSP